MLGREVLGLFLEEGQGMSDGIGWDGREGKGREEMEGIGRERL